MHVDMYVDHIFCPAPIHVLKKNQNSRKMYKLQVSKKKKKKKVNK